MGKVSQFVERQKEGMRRAKEKKEAREAERFMRDKMRLERQEMLEERRARIREQQARHMPKGSKRTTARGMFSGFQDYATGFAQRQQAPSAVGGFGMGGLVSPYAQPSAPKPRPVRKRTKRRRR